MFISLVLVNLLGDALASSEKSLPFPNLAYLLKSQSTDTTEELQKSIPFAQCDSELQNLCKASASSLDDDLNAYRSRLCLWSQKESLSGQCMNYLVIERPSFIEPCYSQITSYCPDVEPGNGRIHKCLFNRGEDLTVRCSKALEVEAQAFSEDDDSDEDKLESELDKSEQSSSGFVEFAKMPGKLLTRRFISLISADFLVPSTITSFAFFSTFGSSVARSTAEDEAALEASASSGLSKSSTNLNSSKYAPARVASSESAINKHNLRRRQEPAISQNDSKSSTEEVSEMEEFQARDQGGLAAEAATEAEDADSDSKSSALTAQVNLGILSWCLQAMSAVSASLGSKLIEISSLTK